MQHNYQLSILHHSSWLYGYVSGPMVCVWVRLMVMLVDIFTTALGARERPRALPLQVLGTTQLYSTLIIIEPLITIVATLT